MDYNQLIKGCDIGLFPSYYEPWGYTPVEFAKCGVPSITTNLSGFGDFMTKLVPGGPNNWGITVLDRKNTSLDDSINRLSMEMNEIIHRSSEEVNVRFEATQKSLK